MARKSNRPKEPAREALASEAQVFDFICSRGDKTLRPDLYLTVSEWADRFRFLSHKESGEPGPWRTARTPYLKDIMDALSAQSPYEQIVFMKGAQIGATEAGLNWLGYIIDVSPRPVMIVWPTEQNIKDNVAIRITPLLSECPSVAEKIIAQHGTRDPANNTFLKDFPGGHLTMAASNSSAALRSKPICYLFLDEVDEYPGNVNQQGDPVDLSIARTRTFSGRRKIYICSTPTVAGSSRIEKAYEKTDQRRFFVPCPHCGAMQWLQFKNLRWPKGRPDQAWCECEACGARIHNHDKEEMLARGQWRASVENYRGKAAGFHLSSLYSPPGMFSWGEIASKWAESRNDVQKRKTFMNTVLGVPYLEVADLPEWEKLYERREPYKLGTVPMRALFLTAGADVQKDRIEVLIRGWGRSKESWVIDYRVFTGDTSDIASDAWRGLDLLMTSGYKHELGATLYICCIGIDTGFNTQNVYSWARRFNEARVMPVKGEDSLMMPVAQPRAVDIYKNGKRSRGAIKMYRVGVSLFKQELYGWLNIPRPDAGEEPAPGYIHFCEELDEEFFKQLCSEQLVVTETKLTKKEVRSWKKFRDRNEALDCAIYSRAAAAKLNIDLYKEADWEKIEKSVYPEGFAGLIPARKQPDEIHNPAPSVNAPGQPAHYRRRAVLSRGVKLD